MLCMSLKNRQGDTVHTVIDWGVHAHFHVFQIENAASLDALQECMMRHSTMLQTAGCLRHVATVEEKKEIVSDYLQWYIIDHNSSVIDR